LAFNKFLNARKAVWGVDYIAVSYPEYYNPDKMVLPERAKLIVKEDITVEKLFANLSKDIGPYQTLMVPDFDEEYYLFRPMFSKVANKDNFRKQVNRMLDSLPAETIIYELKDRISQETAMLELLVQNYSGWTFVRAAALQYKGLRFEHILRNPTGANVYPEDSKAVEPLRERCIAFRPTLTDQMLRWFIIRFLWPEFNGESTITFINEECTLNFSVRATWGEHKERVFEVRFVTEMDYTTFLDRTVNSRRTETKNFFERGAGTFKYLREVFADYRAAAKPLGNIRKQGTQKLDIGDIVAIYGDDIAYGVVFEDLGEFYNIIYLTSQLTLAGAGYKLQIDHLVKTVKVTPINFYVPAEYCEVIGKLDAAELEKVVDSFKKLSSKNYRGIWKQFYNFEARRLQPLYDTFMHAMLSR
jgi:hypothetical protein